MIRSDKSIYLPPADEIKNMDDVKEWMRKASNLLGVSQSDLYDDLGSGVQKDGTQTVTGTKTFNSIKLGGNMDCNQKQMLSMCVEVRTSDPSSPVIGQMWLRSDLLP